MFGFAGVPLVTEQTLYYLAGFGVLYVMGFVGATSLVRDVAARVNRTRIGALLEPVVLLLLLVVCTAYLVDGSFSPFLYFRF
jgi:alginate O-acetyltransferase complex protein AlgI